MSEKIINSEILIKVKKGNYENISKTFMDDSKTFNVQNKQRHRFPISFYHFHNNGKNKSNYLNSTNELTIDTRSFSNKPIKKIPNNVKIHHFYKTINLKNNNKEENNNNIDFNDNYNIFQNKRNTNKRKNIVLNHFSHPSKSIYKDLAIRQNTFINLIHKKTISKSNSLSNRKRKICLNNIPISNFFQTKKNDLFISKFDSTPRIYLLENDLNISEKNRYQNIMNELHQLKNILSKNPKEEENQIINEFLLKHDIFDIEFYDVDKIQNLLNFLQSDFKVNCKKSIKENIKDILNGKYKLTNEYNKKEIVKEKINKTINETLKDKINLKKQLNLKGVITHNLNLQSKLYYEEQNKINLFDFNEQPEKIIKKLEKEFKQEIKKENILPVIPPFKSIDLKNQKLYCSKKDFIDYEDIKKKNKLTEYICYHKANNNIKLKQIKDNLKKNFNI